MRGGDGLLPDIPAAVVAWAIRPFLAVPEPVDTGHEREECGCGGELRRIVEALAFYRLLAICLAVAPFALAAVVLGLLGICRLCRCCPRLIAREVAARASASPPRLGPPRQGVLVGPTRPSDLKRDGSGVGCL